MKVVEICLIVQDVLNFGKLKNQLLALLMNFIALRSLLLYFFSHYLTFISLYVILLVALPRSF